MTHKNYQDYVNWRNTNKVKEPEKWKKQNREQYLIFIEKCRNNPEVWKRKMEYQRIWRGRQKE